MLLHNDFIFQRILHPRTQKNGLRKLYKNNHWLWENGVEKLLICLLFPSAAKLWNNSYSHFIKISKWILMNMKIKRIYCNFSKRAKIVALAHIVVLINLNNFSIY